MNRSVAVTCPTIAEYRHTLRRARQLGRLIDEVVDADWRHPGWWLLCGGVAGLEARPAPALPDDPIRTIRDHYFTSTGGPESDTFMARMRPAPTDPGARIADAVMCARAAIDTLLDLHDHFPGQPLNSYLERHRTAFHPAAVDLQQRAVAFAGARGAVLARLSSEPAGDVRLAKNLVAFVQSGRVSADLMPVDTHATRATPAAVTVAIGNESRDCARHVHRRGWSAGGGPWLGVGTSARMQVISSAHMIVDGYGHARITTELLRRHDQLAGSMGRALCAASHAPRSMDDLPRLAGAEPMGIAGAYISGRAPDFATLAHALGCALEKHVRGHMDSAARRAFCFTPAFQVPVAPGTRNDPERWRRRIVNALLSVRMDQGEFEPIEHFRARLPAFLARERAAEGLLTRMQDAVMRAPAPIFIKRHLFSGARIPRPWLPMIAAMAGRSRLSLFRFVPGEEPGLPIYATSAAPLHASPADPRGSSVVSIMPAPGGMTITVGGKGATGSEAGARAFLDLWLEHWQ